MGEGHPERVREGKTNPSGKTPLAGGGGKGISVKQKKKERHFGEEKGRKFKILLGGRDFFF